ncbi:MAG: AfsR/SARP family transcriptional regulator, partial [Sporomusa sp.]
MNIIVTLIGTCRVIADGKEVIFPFRKAEGLFYYLCVKGTVFRDEVIGLLWADCAENVARKNLRDALYHLKKLFTKDIFSINGYNKISLQKDRIDEIDYDKLMEGNFFELYNGEFLHCFYVKNSIEFDEWVTGIREDLKRRYFKVAESRIMLAARNGNSRLLLDYAAILMHKKIDEEFLYREILAGLIKNGNYLEAEQLYQRLSDMVRDEYGVDLEENTISLMKEAS